MCIALPMRIVAIVDAAAHLVEVAPDPLTAPDRAAREIVSAALLVEDEPGLAALVGGWGVTHAGFLLARLDEADARSRLDVFAALDDAAAAMSAGRAGSLVADAEDGSPVCAFTQG